MLLEDTFPRQYSTLLKDLSLKTRHHIAANAINELIKENKLSYSEAITCLTAVTDKAILEFDKKDYGTYYIDKASQFIRTGLNNLWAARNTSSVDDEKSFFNNIALLICDYDQKLPIEKKIEVCSSFCEGLREVIKVVAAHRSNYQLNFSSLKISFGYGDDELALAILPDDPRYAVACLHRQNSRTLFADYGGKESAECFVAEWYGRNGKYAHYYNAFLNCKDRYPTQKILTF